MAFFCSVICLVYVAAESLKTFCIFYTQEAEQNHAEELEKVEQEKGEISQRLEEMMRQETSLSAKVKKKRQTNQTSMLKVSKTGVSRAKWF